MLYAAPTPTADKAARLPLNVKGLPCRSGNKCRAHIFKILEIEVRIFVPHWGRATAVVPDANSCDKQRELSRRGRIIFSCAKASEPLRQLLFVLIEKKPAQVTCLRKYVYFDKAANLRSALDQLAAKDGLHRENKKWTRRWSR